MNEPEEFSLETTTVWSFPERGDWATHSGSFPGNFSPKVARNVILRYSKEEDTVLDPMMGSGTTLIEAKLLNRKGIGIDINPEILEIAKRNLNFKGKFKEKLFLGDARSLSFLKDESVDLVLTHPPYLNIIKYSNGKIPGDFSNISGVKKFCSEISVVFYEVFRVLKPNRYFAILIGDTRRRKHYIPLAFYVMEEVMKAGFLLKEDIIKIQHNCSSTPYWTRQSIKYNFYLIMHEHLFVFRKPDKNEDLSKFTYSRIKTNGSR